MRNDVGGGGVSWGVVLVRVCEPVVSHPFIIYYETVNK